MVDQDSRKGLVSGDEWHWYDKSKLSFWLRYDTWPVELGLCLICDIDPEKSEELDFDDLVDMVDIKPEDKPSYALYKALCLLSEDPIYKLEPKNRPTKYDFSDAKQYLKGRVDWLEVQYFKKDRDDIKPEYVNPDYTDICDRIRLRGAAHHKQMECRILFFSNPKHGAEDRFAPAYFIEWARSKDISIPWLLWAESWNLWADPTTEKQLDGDSQKRATPSDARCEEGMKAALRLLRQEHETGNLRNSDDFKRCMTKVSVTKFIRNHPADFPLCAKVRSYTEKQSFKDREPTLRKDFSDFAKATAVVEEYERLVSSN